MNLETTTKEVVFVKKMKKIEFWSECFKYFQFIKNN